MENSFIKKDQRFHLNHIEWMINSIEFDVGSTTKPKKKKFGTTQNEMWMQCFDDI